MMLFLKQLFARFFPEHKNSADIVRESKDMREHLSERQLDKIVEDSFPASDPPARY